MFVYIGCQGSDYGHGLWTPGMRHPTAVEDTRHAWVHKDRYTMADRTLYELMGLQPNASLESIKSAFRTLAKQYHPDKNSSPDATKAFQKLNTAYQTLVSLGNDRDQEDNGSDSSVSIALPNVTLITRENTFSITIDIIDIMFLVFMEECELHHNVRPVDRGSNGIQFRFDYTSPDDAENFGTLSLTFYATTSRLLVQGTSYLLWVDEHLPLIYKRAESRYTEDLGTWRSLTRRRGIGLRRNPRTTRQTSLRQAKAQISGVTHDGQMTVTTTTLNENNDLSVTNAQPNPETSPALLLSVSSGPDTLACHTLPSPPKHGGHDLPKAPASPQALSEGTHDLVAVSSGSPPSEAGSDSRALPAPELPNDPAPDPAPQPDCPRSEVPASVVPGDDKVTNGVKPVVKPSIDNKKSKKIKKGSKSKSKKAADTTGNKPPPGYCYTDCADQGKADPNMIRCSICMIWIHISCSGEDQRYMGAWTCKNCRNIPSVITTLQTKLTSLETFVKSTCSNNQDLVNEIKLLKAENGNLKQKLASVNQHNSELKKLIETMSEQSYVQPQCKPSSMQPSDIPQWPTGCDLPGPGVSTHNRYAALAALDGDPTGPCPTRRHSYHANRPTPKPVTLTIVGSSIVRGVAPLVHGKDCDASGYVYPGRTARQINAQIKHIPPSDVTVLAAGTNNIEKQPLGQCKEEIRQMIDNVSHKRKDNIVIMSRIPPRHDKPILNKKIDDVNDFIVQELKQRKNWHILTHELSRDDFKKDGLHFNEIGRAKYAHEIRHIVRNLKRK